MNGDFRNHAALQFALALCRSEQYTNNPAFQKNRNDYIADDAVDLADALISRLAVQPEHAASPKIRSIEFSEAS